MADTHPNAYRVEAANLRSEARRLLDSADALDLQASDLEKELGLPDTTPAKPEDQLPPGGQTFDPETETDTEKKSRVPFKKS